MSDAKKRTDMSLDGHFLRADVYEYPSGEQRLDVMYLETPKKHEVILTERFASREVLYKAFVDGPLSADLSARARRLVPAIDAREANDLAEMAPLQFEAQDVRCFVCGARPGEPCFVDTERCQQGRVEDLHHFLIWLAEQRHRSTKRPTKKLVIDVAEMIGYNTATNLYYRGHGVVLTHWSTGDCWRFYVGGRLDPTKSIWLTSGSDMSDPERGPFRDEREIALAMRALGRGE